jgi:hypothetical protein
MKLKSLIDFLALSEDAPEGAMSSNDFDAAYSPATPYKKRKKRVKYRPQRRKVFENIQESANEIYQLLTDSVNLNLNSGGTVQLDYIEQDENGDIQNQLILFVDRGDGSTNEVEILNVTRGTLMKALEIIGYREIPSSFPLKKLQKLLYYVK